MIPVESVRKAVSEVAGFILGTQLLKIGDCEFDANNNVIRRTAENPWGDNVRSKCNKNASPPIKINRTHDYRKVERIFNKLVPEYLNVQAKFELSDVLWKYWISKELAIGTNLPIMASALEVLATNYLSKNEILRTYTGEEKRQYEVLITPFVEKLSKELETYEFKDRVLKFLKTPFNPSMTEKLKFFLDKLDVHFDSSSIESEAIKARHKMTHSKLATSDEEVKEYIRISHAFESLLNRIILPVLGYDEDYIDYYSIGHPSLSIKKNIGEI